MIIVGNASRDVRNSIVQKRASSSLNVFHLELLVDIVYVLDMSILLVYTHSAIVIIYSSFIGF